MDNQNNCIKNIENMVTGNDIKEQVKLAEISPPGIKETEEQNIVDCSNNINTTESIETSNLQKNYRTGLDAFVTKALEKIKENFLSNDIDEQKLAEFMFKVLSLNITHFNPNDIKVNTDLLDNLMEEIVGNHDIGSESNQIAHNIIDKIFGLDASETISEKLSNEKIDDLIEKLLGEDTKKLICEKLQSENLEELFDKLIDEKFKLDENPEAQHPDFDSFIEQILGKDTEEFIRQKLETFLNENISDDDSKVLELD